MPEHVRNAARGAKPGATWRQRHRWKDHAARKLPHQPEEEEAHRGMFWLAEDDCAVTQDAPSRNVESGLDLYVRVRRLQPGAHAKSDGCVSSSVVSRGRGVSEGSRKHSGTLDSAKTNHKRNSPTLQNDEPGRTVAYSMQFFRSLLEKGTLIPLIFRRFTSTICAVGQLSL